jgi:8-demethyl-8-alpha-L-rhamnosyltetracenomycin-C 2'-O-methyltransferase
VNEHILTHLANKYGTTKLGHASYMRAYASELDRHRLSIKTVLEMGIGDGSSLRMWADYFPHAQIYGLDIAPNEYRFTEEERLRITCVQGDQADGNVLSELQVLLPQIDIVIDDAGHDVRKQQVALRFLWPLVTSGGWYVIEDLESSYWAHSGGFRGPGTTVEFLKSAMDTINRKYVCAETRLEEKHFVLLPGLESAHWYANICFLQKGYPCE